MKKIPRGTFQRLIWQKLILPMLRSTAAPQEKARGVAVGLSVALTPLVGVQMVVVLLMWGIAKKLKWCFSLPLALAWTWVTNVATMVPVYYVFYVTGQIMRGHWHNITGYESIARLIEHVFAGDASFIDKTKDFIHLFVQDWGISLFVGCVPYVILGYVGGYCLTLRFEQMRKKRKEKNGTLRALKQN